MPNRIFAIALMGALLWGCEKPDPAAEAGAQVIAAADFYLEGVLRETPEVAYFTDLPLARHDGLSDISPQGLARLHALEDQTLAMLEAVDAAALAGTPERVLHGQLKEMVAASVQARVCRRELWSVNHMFSFYNSLGELAARQPVATKDGREQAIARWNKVPGYIADDIENLRRGIAQGYLAPKPAVARVIAQVDGLINTPKDTSPLYDPARRAGEAMFAAAFAEVIERKVLPALASYRDFLETEYLAHARDDRSLDANPGGRECWIALYRGYTTLERTPEEVYELGLAAVNRYRRDVAAIGAEAYGADSFAEAVRLNAEDAANRLQSREAYAALLEGLLARAEQRAAAAFAGMPETPVVIEPYPEFLQGTGMSARYERSSGGEPAVFRYDPAQWDTQTIGGAEILTVHEAFPGHHLQIAYSAEQPQLHPVQKLIFNSAFAEGWARYSEALAEELGIYTGHFAKIQRRAWPARGMVVDSALHALGWTDQQALEFLRESGRFAGEDGVRMLDRVSVIPAQLTAYDSGALELFALRRMAERELGAHFDLAAFHQALLRRGAVPLAMLRTIIEDWVAQQKAERGAGQG